MCRVAMRRRAGKHTGQNHTVGCGEGEGGGLGGYATPSMRGTELAELRSAAEWCRTVVNEAACLARSSFRKRLSPTVVSVAWPAGSPSSAVDSFRAAWCSSSLRCVRNRRCRVYILCIVRKLTPRPDVCFSLYSYSMVLVQLANACGKSADILRRRSRLKFRIPVSALEVLVTRL